MQLKNPRDFASGVMFTVVGVVFAVGALNYHFGQSARPGPGYFPFGLGVLLALLGLVICAKSVAAGSPEDDSVGAIAWRPLTIVVAAIALFGWALPHLGMVLALPLLVIVISAAGDEFHWPSVLLSCVVLTVGSWLVFVQGLGLIIPLWPSLSF